VKQKVFNVFILVLLASFLIVPSESGLWDGNKKPDQIQNNQDQGKRSSQEKNGQSAQSSDKYKDEGTAYLHLAE